MVNEDELSDEVLSGEGLFCGDCDVTHHVTFRRIKINLLKTPLSVSHRLNASLGVFGAINKIIEHCSLRWEFSSGLPFRFPPIGELFPVIEAILLSKATTATPNDSEHKREFDVTELFS